MRFLQSSELPTSGRQSNHRAGPRPDRLSTRHLGVRAAASAPRFNGPPRGSPGILCGSAAAEGAACFAIRLIETQPAWLAWFDAIGSSARKTSRTALPQRDPLVRILFYKIFFWRLVAGVCCPRQPSRYATVRHSQRPNYPSRKTGGTARRLPRSTTSAISTGWRAISISAKGRFLSYDGVLATARTGAAAVAEMGCGEQAPGR